MDLMHLQGGFLIIQIYYLFNNHKNKPPPLPFEWSNGQSPWDCPLINE